MTDSPAVEIEPYDPRWRECFEEEGVVLLEALQEAVRDIAHVGATAVPGLPARPVIDILVGVDTLESVARHVVSLQQIGYEYLGEAGLSERLLFRKRDGDAFDLSVVLHGGEHWQRRLRIREYLRAHDELVERLGEKKQSVARQVESLDEYRDVMADHYDTLAERADAWFENAGG